MAETPCFFGLTTARVGARVVAYLQFWSQLFIVMLLVLRYFREWLVVDETATVSNKNATTANETATYAQSTPMKYYNELDFDIAIFSQLSGALLVMYASYYLKIATYTKIFLIKFIVNNIVDKLFSMPIYEHNLMYINIWILLNSLNFLTSVAFIIFASLRIGKLTIFFTGLFGCLIKGCALYVVYQFYTDETLAVTVNDVQNPPSNGDDQSLPRNRVAVDIRSETIGTNDHRHPTLDVKNITQNSAQIDTAINNFIL